MQKQGSRNTRGGRSPAAVAEKGGSLNSHKYYTEVIIYGRGGQGNVTAAEVLANAVFKEGRFSQGLPFFGAERMGAPVQANVRMSDRPIRVRTQVRTPEILLIQDEGLLDRKEMINSVVPGGTIIVNTKKSTSELHLRPDVTVHTCPASEIAMEIVGRPNANMVMLGSFASITGEVGIEAVKEAIMERFPGTVGKKNAAAAEKAFRSTDRS